MNHLAHLFLSQHSEKMMIGNFIADGVKGKKYLDYEEEIARGIMMHREIDTFTDSHPIVSKSKRFFRERYGLFSPVLIDLFYDHYLARNWTSYNATPLADFAANAYRFENGRLMAGKGCAFQPPSCEDIKGQSISTHPLLIYRVAAVDEEAGITWLRMNFGSRDSYGGGAPAANDKGGKAGKAKGPPTELIVWEAFKVYGGQIHAVEAFMRVMPATAGSGWD